MTILRGEEERAAAFVRAFLGCMANLSDELRGQKWTGASRALLMARIRSTASLCAREHGYAEVGPVLAEYVIETLTINGAPLRDPPDLEDDTRSD